jgi:hypothetical protein
MYFAFNRRARCYYLVYIFLILRVEWSKYQVSRTCLALVLAVAAVVLLYSSTIILSLNIQAYAAQEPNGKLESFQYELDSLKPDEVELDVEYCGICYSDLSMLKNEWDLHGTRSYLDMKLSAKWLRLVIW